jgi:hypothetical protein
VNRLSMMVTAEGEWVFEESPEFLAALGDPNPDYDASLFAVKNLGFIRFQILDNSIIEIELHPTNVELTTLLAVQQQILSSRIKLFRIKYFDTTWYSEITASPERAASRLSELCAPAFAPPPSQKFVVEPRDYSSLLQDEENPLRLMAQKWRMSLGAFDPTVISFAIKHQLLSRMMIVGVRATRPDPIFRFIGDGFNWLEPDFQYRAIGERIVNQPDKEYGAWVSEFYKSVAATGQPRYDMVRAGIQVHGTGPHTFLTRYERLLLPWRTPSDEVFVTLSSKRLADEEASFAIADSDDNTYSASAKSS